MEPAKKLLLALVGMPGSGKSFAADFFRQKGIPVLRFGDQTDIGLKELNRELTEANERWYREKIRQELGMAAMAIKIEPRIQTAYQTHSQVVLDGLYSWAEYTYLKERFPQLLLLHVWSAPAIRYQRLMKRTVRPLTKEEAQSRDWAEIEQLEKGGPIAIADLLLTNMGTAQELTEQLEKIYMQLL